MAFAFTNIQSATDVGIGTYANIGGGIVSGVNAAQRGLFGQSPTADDLLAAGESKGRQLAIASRRETDAATERNLNSLFAVNNVLAAQNAVQKSSIQNQQLSTTYLMLAVGGGLALLVFMLRK